MRLAFQELICLLFAVIRLECTCPSFITEINLQFQTFQAALCNQMAISDLAFLYLLSVSIGFSKALKSMVFFHTYQTFHTYHSHACMSKHACPGLTARCVMPNSCPCHLPSSYMCLDHDQLTLACLNQRSGRGNKASPLITKHQSQMHSCPSGPWPSVRVKRNKRQGLQWALPGHLPQGKQ